MTTTASLLNVETTTLGEPLTADVAAAATALPVVDATTFREDGGLLRIGDRVYTYTAADPATNVITIVGGLAVAVLADDLVEVYPVQQMKRALVDVDIPDGEGVWAVVPQSLVLTLADGIRYEGQREIVTVEDRGGGDLYLLDVEAQSNVAASTVLAEGSIPTAQIEVGTTGNLVQDPAFLGTFWQPPRKFSVAGPDIVYTDSNFVRCTGTSEANVAHDAGTVDDWDWWLVDKVPVDAGRTVRVKALVRRDATSITGTSSNAQARVRISFYKADLVTVSSPAECYSILALATDTVVDTWTLLEVTATVPEGYTHFTAGLQCSFQTLGAVDFIKPEIQVLWDRTQSPTYDPGKAGWAWNDEVSQVEELHVLGEVGASVGSFGALSIGGVDLETEYLTPLPLGLIAYDYKGSAGRTNPVATGITELKMFEFSAGALRQGRLYRIGMMGQLQGSVANDIYEVILRYTLDGSSPTISSALMRRWRVPTTIAAQAVSFDVERFYSPSGDATPRFGISLQRANGTGTGYIKVDEVGKEFFVYMEDCGLYAPAAAAGTLAQKSGIVDSDPSNTFTKTYWATWGRSYDGNGNTRNPDEDGLYQGYYSSNRGNTRSLVGFDYATIQADLVGASVTKCILTYRVQHSHVAAGITSVVGTHNYTSKPSTWADATVNQNRYTAASQKAGVTYARELNHLGIGAEFKAGTSKGIAFGPAPSNSPTAYYGYFNGAIASADRPRLTITYEK